MNDLIHIIAASPLRQRLFDDMTMRRFSRETQRNYIPDVGRPQRIRCCPDAVVSFSIMGCDRWLISGRK